MSAVSLFRISDVRRKLASFRRLTEGATAVEFAMVGLPFFMLLTAVFEAGLVTLAQQSLDNAVDRASRDMYTGAFQTAATSTPGAQRFKSAICTALVYIDCSTLAVEVTVGSTFAESSPSNPYNSKTKSANANFGSTFQCPAADDIVTVRAAATVPRFFGFLTLNGLQLASGKQMVISTAIFRAEPYPSGNC